MISNQLLLLGSPQARTAPPTAPRGTIFIVWIRVDFLVGLVARFGDYRGFCSLGGRLGELCLHRSFGGNSLFILTGSKKSAPHPTCFGGRFCPLG